MMHDMLKLGVWDQSVIALNSKGGFDHFLKNPLGAEAIQALMDDFPTFYKNFLHSKYEQFGITGADRVRENQLLLGRQGGKGGNLTEKILPLMDNAFAAYQRQRTSTPQAWTCRNH